MTRPQFPSALLFALLFALLSGLACSSPALGQNVPPFTEAQARAGQATYRELCQICHGSSLANGQFGTPLRGSFFRDKWQGKSVDELLQFMYEKMPPDNVMSLSPEQSAELLAYIFLRNDITPGTEPLPGDSEALGSVMLPW